ncbi:alpha/beta hydrolase [Dyella sp. C9]|uniref:serine aminopeptidase domain-containing protein n=1 Tax=Dyella sp. C9 TaxID=2202154 RepID=UPI000DEED03E|nr:alpha/beta hydrolase [Dyella sp. C9]
MTRHESELPFFFGNGGELFGIYHPAGRKADRAVLLCAPLGQDHIRCHRLYRQLATTLAGEGLPVLRFDYYGCGDSAGASGEVEWGRCLHDVVSAAQELRRRSGVPDIVAFGARLGGPIALAAAQPAGFTDVLAWDPVIDGAAYVTRLDEMQEALLQDTRRFVRPRGQGESQGQWLGFEVNPTLRRQIAELRPPWGMRPSLVLDTLGATAPDWRELGIDASHVRVIEPATPWDDLARLEAAIISHPLLQAVSAHVHRVHA